MALILFGAPGSGKGTQAKILSSELGMPHISTGDMLRSRMDVDDALGRVILAVMKSGQLVPDEMVNRMVEERIDQPDCQHGFILDGYPRTLRQAEMVEWLLAARGLKQLVIHLQVDYNKLVGRLTARRQCPQCGTLYNLLSKPPLIPGRCDIEGAKLSIRTDDSEPVIRQRLEAYEAQTTPLIEHFRGSGCLRDVDASERAPEEIAAEIRRLVEEFRASL
ncbi:MAG: adenylate kinase [Bryobacteraceae bacterium]|nr:adenylate kinase [Bryobacteraceae bacterium]